MWIEAYTTGCIVYSVPSLRYLTGVMTDSNNTESTTLPRKYCLSNLALILLYDVWNTIPYSNIGVRRKSGLRTSKLNFGQWNKTMIGWSIRNKKSEYELPLYSQLFNHTVKLGFCRGTLFDLCVSAHHTSTYIHPVHLSSTCSLVVRRSPRQRNSAMVLNSITGNPQA